jgi:hypothetical protein
MSNNIIFVLKYHRHKLLDLIKAVYETLQSMPLYQCALRTRGNRCDFRGGFSVENFVRHTAYGGSYDLLVGESRQLTLILKYGLLLAAITYSNFTKKTMDKGFTLRSVDRSYVLRKLNNVSLRNNSTIHDENVTTMSRNV